MPRRHVPHKLVIFLLALLVLGVGSIPQAVQAAAPFVEVQAEPVIHTVVRGDTLSGLARRYGTTVAAIQAANNLTSTTIYVGQRLRIPQGTGSPQPGSRERIQFAPGTTATTVTGTVPPQTRKEYVLRARGGQTMHVEVGSSQATVYFRIVGLSDGVTLKRMEESSSGWSGVLPRTQDYLIQVMTYSDRAATFSLYVSIPPLAGGEKAQRIQFAPGSYGATVYGFATPITPKRYVLRALKGQTMDVTLQADSVLSHIAVRTPGGQVIGGGEYRTQQWTGYLPATGDYVIEVFNAGEGAIDFGLSVAVW